MSLGSILYSSWRLSSSSFSALASFSVLTIFAVQQGYELPNKDYSVEDHSSFQMAAFLQVGDSVRVRIYVVNCLFTHFTVNSR